METEYTKGFKAGVAWQTDYVVRMLAEWLPEQESITDYLAEKLKASNGPE